MDTLDCSKFSGVNKVKCCHSTCNCVLIINVSSWYLAHETKHTLSSLLKQYEYDLNVSKVVTICSLGFAVGVPYAYCSLLHSLNTTLSIGYTFFGVDTFDDNNLWYMLQKLLVSHCLWAITLEQFVA